MEKKVRTSKQEEEISKYIIKQLSSLLTREANTISIDREAFLKSISENILSKIENIAKIKKKNIVVVNKNDAEKERKKRVPQRVRNVLKWVLVLSWEKIKRQKMANLYKYREYLLNIAVEYLKADEFSDLRIVLPRKRRYVADIEKAKAINMDSAKEIIDYLRYERPPKDEKEVVLYLLIELLWQGIPLRYILDMSIFSFNPKDNIIHMKMNNTYDNVSVDPAFWARFDGLLRKLPKYYLSYRAKNIISFREYYPAKRGYVAVNSLLRAVARKIKIKRRKGINSKNIVEAGKASKIFCLNVRPSCFSALSGRKPNTTVLSLNKWYSELKNVALDSGNKEMEKDAKEKVIDLTSTTKEYLKECRRVLLKYENKEQRKETIEQLRMLRNGWLVESAISNRNIIRGPILRHLANNVQTKVLLDSIKKWDVKKMRIELLKRAQNEKDQLHFVLEKELNQKDKISFLDIVDWIIHSCEEELTGKSVLKYLSTVGRMLIYCELYDIDMLQLDEDDVELMILNQDPVSENNKTKWINKNTFDDIITAFNSLYKYLEPKKPLKKIEFDKLRYMVDNSPKIVNIPEETAVRAKIKNLLSQKKEKQAIMCILGCYLGLRRQEMIDLKTRNVRIYNGKYDYIVFIGKGGKERHVYLRHLPESPENYKHIFYSYIKKAIDKNYDRFLDIVKMEQIKDIFEKDLKDTFIDGIHAMRRFFATRSSKNGLSAVQTSCMLGHESLSMLKTYNQNRFRYTEQEAKSVYQELPHEISEKQLANYLVCSTKEVYRMFREIDLCKNRRQNANRKKGEKVNYVKLQFIYSFIQNKLEKKFKNIQAKKRAKILLKTRLPESKRITSRDLDISAA